MPPISARNNVSAPQLVGSLHALWRPGGGLAVWFDAAPDSADSGAAPGTVNLTALPESVAALVVGRRLRRDIAVIGPHGHRRLVSAMTLGVSSAVALLDATRSTPVGGDIGWYRLILDGVRRFVAAGAVAPALAEVAGETVTRWQPVPTPTWRSWVTVVTAGAPPALIDNGGPAALADLTAELLDHACRARLAASALRMGSATPSTPLIAAFVDDPTPPSAACRPTARAAWNHWSSSAPQEDSSLIFRLHEPDTPEHGLADPDEIFAGSVPGAAGPPALWRLQVCRQSADGHIDPVAPHRLDPHDLDQVTTALATAQRAFAELSRAEPDRASLDFLLDTATVEALLTHGAAALADEGLPVLLPRTIADVRPVLGIRAGAVPGGGAPARMVGLREVREFEWRLALGDTPDALTLTDAEIDELSRQKGDLVRVRGVWMRAEAAALTRAAAFIRTQRALRSTGQAADFGELFGLIAGGVDALPVPVAGVTGLGWLDDIARTGTLRPASAPAPRSLGTELRPYQQRGLDWLAYLSSLGVGGVLADDMGLGKTVQVIALLCRDHECADNTADNPRPTLVVCPMSVVGNWCRELHRFAPHLRVLVHHGADRMRGTDFAASAAGADVVITTFTIVSRDRELFTKHSWRRLVVDEAQHVKNVRTAAAKAVRAVPARHRLALTGTPVENRLEDLRAVIDLVNPGLLGSASTFRARFAIPIERDRDPDALRRLTRLTAPFILRRCKTDPAIIGDLPEKTTLTVRANLSVEQAALYRAIIDELMASLADRQQRALRRRTVLAALTRLKQVCNHPAHYLGDGSPMMRRHQHRSGKIELLGDMAAALIADGDRALVFTQFAAFGEMLAGWLSEQLESPIPVLHGGIGRTARDEMVARFQSADGPPILVATLKAGGSGLNLTAANHVIHVDRWWNPAVEDQATDRAYRIGQRRDVHVRKFVCVGTLEERIDDMIVGKRELSRLTVSSGENWISDLGDDELFDLFRLRDEAVSE
ncbi:MAG: DEAD/DEAH box helicase [Gordonia sp. (in: high G+C Gram-positive bacteria)]